MLTPPQDRGITRKRDQERDDVTSAGTWLLRRAGHFFRSTMNSSSSQSELGSLLGCLMVWFVAMAVTAIMQALVQMVQALAFLSASLLVTYIASWILVVVVAAIIDTIRYRRQDAGVPVETPREILTSGFPRHRYLGTPDYLDHHLWLAIQGYLFEQARDRHKRRLTKSGRLDNVEELKFRPQSLLRSAREFERWRQHEFLDALHNETTAGVLALIRQKLHDQYLLEADGTVPITRLAAVINSKSDRFICLRDRWYLLRFGVYLLTFLKVYRGYDSPEQREWRRREALRQLITDSQLFETLLERRFFTIMRDLGPYPLQVPVQTWLEVQLKKRGGQQFLKEASELLALEDGRARQARLRAKQRKEQRRLAAQNEEQQRLFEKKYAAKAQQLRNDELRERYLRERSPIILFDQYAAGDLEFVQEIHEVALRAARRSRRRARKTEEQLAVDPEVFAAFWQEHEIAILERHDERVQYQEKTAGKKTDSAWIEREAAKAFAQHQRENQLIQRGQELPVDARYGYLLAMAREAVQRRVPGADLDASTQYIQKELHRYLGEADAEARFFGEQTRILMGYCEDFRQGVLSFGQRVLKAGFQPDHHRDQLAIAFVENGKRWRQEYWTETFPQLQAGTHEWQEPIDKVREEKNISELEGLSDLFSIVAEIETFARRYCIDKKAKKKDHGTHF
jgi:hypothetical protein